MSEGISLPRVLTLVTQKGGSGKTTIAANLAVAATAAGESVLIFDLDRQQSIMAWGRIREETGLDDIHFIANRRMTIDSLFDRQSPIILGGKLITLVILDCPGDASTSNDRAIRDAHFCLVPCRPSWMDIQASRVTVQTLVRLNRPFAFVLNQCTPGRTTLRTTDAEAGLKTMGSIADPILGQRADYQDAMICGKGVTEYAPQKEAADEIRKLWKWTAKRLEQTDRRIVPIKDFVQSGRSTNSSFYGSITVRYGSMSYAGLATSASRRRKT